MQTGENSKAPGLIHGLGAWAATAVVVGSIIGQAIFLVPSDIARDAGSVGRALAVWLIGGVVMLCATFCYAELGAALPTAGGDYVYISRGVGRLWGFLFGWTSTLIMRPVAGATIAAGLLRLTGFLLPSATALITTLSIPVPFQTQSYQFTLTAAQPLAIAVILLVAGINYVGVRTAGRVQVALTGVKVVAMMTIVVLGLTLGRISWIHSSSVEAPLAYGGVGILLTALLPVIYSYTGFQHLGSVGGEIINPQKNIPRAAVAGSLAVVALYTLINLVYFRVLGFSRVANSQHVASDVSVMLAGANGAKWLTILMMISALGALHVGFLTGPRYSYAMARDGQFFSFVKRIQPVFRTPSGALVFQGCTASLLVLTGTYEELYSFYMFAVGIFFVLTAVALMRLRRKEPALHRPYQAWGYPWSPLVFAGAASAMSANAWLVSPVRSSIGLAAILMGLPFFYYWRKRATR